MKKNWRPNPFFAHLQFSVLSNSEFNSKFRSFGTYTFWVIELRIWQHWKLQMCKFVCKKGVWPPIFFHGWPLIYLGSLSFEFQVIWNIYILSNWSSTSENDENCKCAKFWQKRVRDKNFFHRCSFLCIGSLSFKFQLN